MPPAGGSILYGMGADGTLRHINDVERGEACNCVCPDPNCGQTLIARKGEKKAHHFAHKRGTCYWAVEYVISTIAAQVIAHNGRIVFPELSYHDYMTDSKTVIAEAQQIGITSVNLVEVSGRGNPDLLIARNIAGAERRFLAVISLMHSVKPDQLDRIKATGIDSFLINLKRIYEWRKREDKHFDREALPLEFQDPGFLTKELVNGNGRCMRWLVNTKQAGMQEESRKEYAEWQEREKKRRAEDERKRRELAEQRERELERLHRETAEQRARREAEEARAAEEAAREHEAILQADRARILAELDQQNVQVRDSFGNRWVRCEKCGKVSTVDDFQLYGGAGRINLGICNDCGRKKP